MCTPSIQMCNRPSKQPMATWKIHHITAAAAVTIPHSKLRTAEYIMNANKYFHLNIIINDDGLLIYTAVSQPCSWKHTNTTHFHTLPNQTHLIQLINSLVETPRTQMPVSDKRDIKSMPCWGASMTRYWILCRILAYPGAGLDTLGL